MNLFIIILHFGDVAVTKRCVKSLRDNDDFPKKIIVVNNTKEEIKKEFAKQIFILENKKNLGFAKGVNKGITYALKQKATHVLLLNNDTVIQKPIVKRLLEEMKKNNAGIIGPAILFTKNNKKLYDIGGKINTFSLRTSHREVTYVQEKKAIQVDYVSGCCMLVKKEVLKKIGLLDESFFLYYEDADFCLRAEKAGFQTFLAPSIVISHTLSASKGIASSFTIYNLMKSGITFGRKYARGFVGKTANKLFLLTQAGLFLKANPSSVTAIAKALLS